jgi:Mor family transcriptional regulator
MSKSKALAEIAACIEQAAGLHLGPGQATALTARALEALQERLGGRQVYIPAGQPSLSHRDDTIRSLAAQGLSAALIGQRYGLTRERVRQIVGSPI